MGRRRLYRGRRSNLCTHNESIEHEIEAFNRKEMSRVYKLPGHRLKGDKGE
ncbi:hypothetical protein Hanom_Chr05g00390531 [Helianthus anomalus]